MRVWLVVPVGRSVILATNYANLEKVYPQLAAIAPTVAYKEKSGMATFQENAAVIGRAVGREARMARAVADVTARIDALAARLPGLRGKTFAGAYYHGPGKFAANNSPNHTAARLLSQLGMRQSPEFAATVVNRSLSPERIDVLECDFLSIGFGSPQLRTELEANPLYAGLGAVRDGRVFVGDNLSSTAGNQPTLLNIPWLLDRWTPVLEKAATR